MANHLSSMLARWRADPSIGGNVVAWETLPAQAANFAPFPPDLHPELIEALHKQNITNLYSHQHKSWLYAQNNKNVIVVTRTASGKTLCYNLPVLDNLLDDLQARALYLFPTKALTQDQLSTLNAILTANNKLKPAIYDGDTPSNNRSSIRTNARIVLSNPDMLHTGILPHHTRWGEFFRHLRFVIIDELHCYRGVFGSHVANVLRRLRRIAHHYGTNPQFILTSATIANPKEVAEWLVEAPVQVIDDDGAACGARHILIYNPPVLDPALGLRRSASGEAIHLANDLLIAKVQTILFGQSRRGVEMLLRILREKNLDEGVSSTGENNASHREHTIRGYRSGYLPSQRRKIEKGLRDGSIKAVVATNALELGVDIGNMGAALLVGYPGTIASARQQMGRAGRGITESLAVLITSANPLDQYLAHHPEYFFERSPEQVLINADHLLILLAHLRCATFELPFQNGESFGRLPKEQLQEFLDFLYQSGELHCSKGKYFWMSEKYPSQSISLRSTGAENIILQTGEKVIGQVDIESALWMVHPGAVYLHESNTYLVEKLNLEHNLARLAPFDGDYFTEPKRDTTVALLSKQANKLVAGGEKIHGEIEVTTQVNGFRRVRWSNRESLGSEPLELPPSKLQTTGYWLTPSEETIATLQAEGLWSNTPNDYGPGWAALCSQIRNRDEHRCQVCGSPEQERAHDVHHKIPFRAFNSHQEANQPHNLITLCKSCHRQAEISVRMRSGLAGLGYVLWQLAPLFLMCDSGDIGVHSDPKSPLAKGQPTVAIYDQIPAGIGFSARLFELHKKLIQHAHEVVSTCECEHGCPACVGPGGENGYGGKRETLALLRKLLDPAPK